MGIDWQIVVALACVAGAVFILARRVHGWWKGGAGGGCGSGCQTCSVKDSSAPAVKPLVTLELGRPKSTNGRPGTP
ncbi:MAG TPA: hypothetical protein VHX68_20595 [Planctomycetaceae bacterium]|jgi:hypothetical protein|nr:hypothetical protein [Planctomycetaceae bacterium]